MADGDRIDALARQLHEAFLLDTNREGEPWPEKPAAQKAWRRVAAAAVDLLGGEA